MKKTVWVFWALLLMTLIVCYFPLCYRIDIYCIQLWDEGRNVANAIEMLQTKHWFTRHFENKPDMWELKPPFLVWCQALSLSLLGYTELGVRIPSMLFSMSTVILLVFTSKKLTNSMFGGVLASLILVCTMGYLTDHVARFGEHDVVLTFFTTTLIFCWFQFLKTGLYRYFWMACFCILMGWFTKSIIVFMFIPGLFFWTVLNKKLLSVLKDKRFWIGCISILAFIIFYYINREKQSPGYVHLVWMNEWFGRYFNTSTEFVFTKSSFWYYALGFIHGRFFPFIYVFMAGVIWILFDKGIANREVLMYLLLCWATFFVIISAGTKNFWYDAPLYPISALILGILMVNLFDILTNKVLKVAFIVALCALIIPAYAKSIRYTLLPDSEHDELKNLCYYLRDHKRPQDKTIKLVHEGFKAPLYLYIGRAKQSNTNILFSRWDELQSGDIVVTSHDSMFDHIHATYHSEVLDSFRNCKLQWITGKKPGGQKDTSGLGL